MKTLPTPLIYLASGAALLLIALPLRVQAETISLDEESHFLDVPIPASALGGTLQLCQNPGIDTVTAGTCPDGNPISDKVEFDVITETATMGSDVVGEAGIDQPGDEISPSVFTEPVFHVSEPQTSPEVFSYTPTVDQPGFALVDETPVTYEITSDVPEPSTLLLFATGLLLAGTRVRRHRRPTSGLGSSGIAG